MLNKEIIAVCSEIQTKHKNTMCGQNAEFVLHLVVHKVANSFSRVNAELMEDPQRYSGVRLRVTTVSSCKEQNIVI